MTERPEQDQPEQRETEASDETREGLWPLSPKVQIALIGCGLFIFNLLLLLIWGLVILTR